MSIVIKNCERCGRETGVLIMSMFDTSNICLNCKKREEKHPNYKKAVEADRNAIKRGNYNFRGIGKPKDLK